MLSDQLRQAIVADGRTRRELCREADVDETALSHFMAGRRRLALDSVDRLAEVLGIRLSLPKRRRKRKV